MKKAFTLIELLIVIGILAVLIGILLATMNGGTESARAAKCLTNLRNLAAACNNCAMGTGWYPPAGSYERRELDERSASEISFYYYEVPGWLSWNSRGAYRSAPKSHTASSGWFTSSYNQDLDTRLFALTNGVLWKYVSENASVYQCPLHVRDSGDKKPLWSYVMNSRFGWDYSMGSRAIEARIKYGYLDKADRTLLFSELQFLKTDATETNNSEGSGIENDCVLQYAKGEIIGFNHTSGKRTLYAHVAFADGHVEKLVIPAKFASGGWQVEMSQGALKDLTKFLCLGKDISFDGTKYEELVN